MKKTTSAFLSISIVAIVSAVYIFIGHFLKFLPLSSDWKDFYHPAAVSMLKGEGVRVQNMALDTAPLYILFLSILYQFFGAGVFAMRVGHALLVGISTWILYQIGSNLFSRKAGIAAAIAYSIYPLTVYMNGLGQPESLLAVCLLILVFVDLNISQERAVFWGNLARGGLLGVCLLIKPNYLGFWPFWILGESIVFRKSQLNVIKKMVVILVGMLLVVGPWRLVRKGMQSESASLTYARIIYAGTDLRPFINGGGLMPLGQYYGIKKSELEKKGIETKEEEILKHSFSKWKDLLWPNPLKLCHFISIKFFQEMYATDAGKLDVWFCFIQIPFFAVCFLGTVLSFRDRGGMNQRLILFLITYTMTALLVITPLFRELTPLLPFFFLYFIFPFLTINQRWNKKGIKNA